MTKSQTTETNPKRNMDSTDTEGEQHSELKNTINLFYNRNKFKVNSIIPHSCPMKTALQLKRLLSLLHIPDYHTQYFKNMF